MISTLIGHFRRLYQHIKGFRNHLIFLSVLQICTAIFDLLGITFLYISLMIYFTGKLPENVPSILLKTIKNAGFHDEITNILIYITVIILMTRVILGVTKVYYISWLGRSVQMFFTTRLTDKILLSPYQEMMARPSGELAIALGDESYTLGQTMIDLSEVISTLMVMVLYFSAIAYLSIRYFAGLLVVLCTIGSFTLLTIRLGKKFGDNLVVQSKKLSSVMFDLINNMKAIRLFNSEYDEIKKYEKMFSKYRNLHVMKDLFGELTSVIPLLVLYLLVMTILFLNHFKAQSSSLANVSLAVLLFGYTSRILIGSKILVSRLGIAISNAQAGKDVFDILELPYENLEKRTNLRLDFGDEVRFDNITFSHKGQSLSLFVNLDLKIPLRKHLAIVGETGSGKSTLLDLFVGLLRPSSGQIFISGQDLNQVNLRFWRSKVRYLNQEISLFNETIYNNITYGAGSKEMDKVIHFSKLALCHDFITALPDGYNTVLHYQGKNLSGGQKQRLLIAHALICEPEILILDESTSSLDEYTQSIIMQNIIDLFKDKTLIVVTHKSEILSFFEHIIRLDKGKLIYDGNFSGYKDIYSRKISA